MAEMGTASTQIDATVDRILEVINDVEGLPARLSAFHLAKVLERDSEGRPQRAEFEVDARLKVVHYFLEYEYAPNKVSWKMTEGDMNELTGSYELKSKGDGTEVVYSYAIDPGFPVPGFIRKQGVKMMVSGALDDLKKTAESR